MRKVTYVALSGHEDLFQLDEDAYKELRRYLNRASARLRGDVDRGEVLSDLEQSIGEKLALRAGAGSGRPFFSLADVSAVLDEIGAVETGSTEASDFRRAPRRRRRLRRIREGQWIAGVCTGISAYAEIGLGWVRLLFIILTAFTAGSFALVYVLLMFLLPVDSGLPPYEEAHDNA